MSNSQTDDSDVDQNREAAIPAVRFAALRWLLVGIVSGSAGWMLMVSLGPLVGGMPPELLAKGPMAPYDPAIMREMKDAGLQSQLRVASLSFCLVGAAVAAAAGFFAGAWLDRSPGRGLWAGAIGILAGGLAGGIAGFAAVQLEQQLLVSMPLRYSLRAIAGHSCAWAIVGCGVGLAAGIANRALLRTVLLVAVAGIGAALVYSVAGAVLFRMQSTERLIPDGLGNQWFWVVLASASMCLAAGQRPPARTAQNSVTP